MPIYEYECKRCGHSMETVQKMGAEPLKDCPACKKPELSKLISRSAFHLKGEGWYATKGSYAKGSKKEAPAADKKDTKATKKKVDKPAESGKKDG